MQRDRRRTLERFIASLRQISNALATVDDADRDLPSVLAALAGAGPTAIVVLLEEPHTHVWRAEGIADERVALAISSAREKLAQRDAGAAPAPRARRSACGGDEVSFPIMAHGRLLGLLHIETYQRLEGIYLEFLAAVTDQLAIALDRSLAWTAARAASRTTDQVLSTASHDLGNALNSILLTTQLALEGPRVVERRTVSQNSFRFDPALRRAHEGAGAAPPRRRRVVLGAAREAARRTWVHAMSGSVLWVDDDGSTEEALTVAMQRRGFSLTWKSSAAEALEALETTDFDVVVTDLHMEGMDGLALCERIVANRQDLPVVMVTAFGSLEAAVAAIRAGAYDFIVKPFDIELVRTTIARAAQHRALRAEVRRLREGADLPQDSAELRGSSVEIERVKGLISRVAESDAVVLITGDSGTGKELAARAIHQRSQNASGPFIAINCAAMPEALLESELFGHVKGAFTDARSARRGLFLKASGGSLFLDEIAEMPLVMQSKLLRALQERTVRAVGGDTEEPFSARIITATNRDLESEVRARRFREDLFYRVNVLRLALPPLRARGNDVLLLAQHFVKTFAARDGKEITGISAPVAERLLAYSWPGNVRELQNCIERSITFARFDTLVVQDLPENIRDYRSKNLTIPGVDSLETLTMDEVERRYILRVLLQTGGSKTAAAAVLGLDRRTLYRKLERWGQPPAPGPVVAEEQLKVSY